MGFTAYSLSEPGTIVTGPGKAGSFLLPSPWQPLLFPFEKFICYLTEQTDPSVEMRFVDRQWCMFLLWAAVGAKSSRSSRAGQWQNNDSCCIYDERNGAG